MKRLSVSLSLSLFSLISLTKQAKNKMDLREEKNFARAEFIID